MVNMEPEFSQGNIPVYKVLITAWGLGYSPSEG